MYLKLHPAKATEGKICAIKQREQDPTVNWLPAATTSWLVQQEFMSFLFISLLHLTGPLKESKLRWVVCWSMKNATNKCKQFVWCLSFLSEHDAIFQICDRQPVDPRFLEEAEEEMGTRCLLLLLPLLLLVSTSSTATATTTKRRWGQGVRKAPVVLHQPTTQVYNTQVADMFEIGHFLKT